MTIEIQNVGPIESVSIPIPEGGGVVVLSGANGTGKSTALDAIDTMARGSGSLSTRARHGTKRGSIEGLGARVTVGLQKATRKGELEVAAFDARVNVSTLVDPGVKDPEAADRRRIATACGLAGITPDPSKFRALAEDLDESLFGGDLVEVAAKVRSEIQRQARDHEKRGIELAERSRTLADEAGEVEGAPSAEEAQAALEQAIAQQSALRARAEAADEAADRAEKAREALDRLGDHGPDLGSLREAVTATEAECQAAAELVADIEKRLAEARQDLKDANARAIQAGRDFGAAKQAAEDRESARKALEEATASADAPTGDDLNAAHHRVQECRARVALAATAERAASKREQAQHAEAEAVAEGRRAEALRAAASKTDDVLAEHLSSVMPEGLRVLDGRLAIERDGRHIPYAELSDGERWRIALDIAIEAMGGAGLIAIEQPAWEGLDTTARKAIAEHAKQRGVVIVTAEADHGAVVGPLRAEEFTA